MKRYLKLYGSFFRICVMREMEARGSFVATTLLLSLMGIAPLLLIGAIYSRVPTLGGWTFYQYLILVGTYQILSALIYCLFSKNIFGLPEYVRKGELDFFLLKPVNSQFIISMRYLSFTEAGQIVPGLIMLIIGLLNSDLNLSWWQLPTYLLFVLSGVIISYAIWFITVLPSIWWVRMEVQELFSNVIEVARYHPNMFGGIIRTIIVYVLPIGVIVSAPADVLLNRLSMDMAVWTLAIAAILLFGSHRLWKLSLTRYYGASS